MSRRWPLGSEVKRKDLTGGAMLYDASRAGNVTPAWFDDAFWRERGDIEGEALGRGATHFIRNHGKHYVLRHYRRGGLVARVVRDRYLWRGEQETRAFAEWQLLYHLHRAGLPVPAPVAARYRRQGMFYTADLITERLMDSVSLASLLRKRGIPILGWITIGRCLRTFHDLGVCHADLNAHNILLVGDDSVYLLDFDRGRLMKPGLWCDGNLVRLRRSLEKITYKLPPENFSEADWHGLLDGYRQSRGHPGATVVASAVGAANPPPVNPPSTATPPAAAKPPSAPGPPTAANPAPAPTPPAAATAPAANPPAAANTGAGSSPSVANPPAASNSTPPAADASNPSPPRSQRVESSTSASPAPQRSETSKPPVVATPRPEPAKPIPAGNPPAIGTQLSFPNRSTSPEAVDEVPPVKTLSAQ